MVFSNNRVKAAALAIALGLAGYCAVVKNAISAPLLLKGTLRGQTDFTEVFLPPSLDLDSQRKLSLNLGNGNCKWQPPTYDVPAELDLHKTLITGFPSGDKRMIFVQMEALTGWPAKDEWDFEYLGDSNHPFIKANYPHHEGIWGWGANADQVVMMVRNIRRSMIEYHDILYDIGYAKTWEEATVNLDNLYAERPPMEFFLDWRDLRVMDEAHWYSWFIDYWMEGGLMRDIFTHKITTPEHWNMLMMPTVYTRDELNYDVVVGNTTIVDPSYDPHCANGEISGGCEPVAIISAEKLRDPNAGKFETAAIATVLLHDARTGQYVIAQEAWDCIWHELIQNGKGLKTVYDRPGFVESDYDFSEEMLDEMLGQLTRIIDKYSSGQWVGKATAFRLVELLTEHRDLLQAERDQKAGASRTLKDEDFLGPKERARRREIKRQEGTAVEEKDWSEYFKALDQKILELKRREMRNIARKVAEQAKNESPLANF